MEIGQHVCWEGKPLKDQVNQGVRQGYENGYLRKSMVADPLERINTNDNTPAILHTEIVDGDRVTITVMPKGGGSENMGTFKTLLPGDGIDGIKDFVLETVRRVEAIHALLILLVSALAVQWTTVHGWRRKHYYALLVSSMLNHFMPSSKLNY